MNKRTFPIPYNKTSPISQKRPGVSRVSNGEIQNFRTVPRFDLRPTMAELNLRGAELDAAMLETMKDALQEMHHRQEVTIYTILVTLDIHKYTPGTLGNEHIWGKGQSSSKVPW